MSVCECPACGQFVQIWSQGLLRRVDIWDFLTQSTQGEIVWLGYRLVRACKSRTCLDSIGLGPGSLFILEFHLFIGQFPSGHIANRNTAKWVSTDCPCPPLWDQDELAHVNIKEGCDINIPDVTWEFPRHWWHKVASLRSWNGDLISLNKLNSHHFKVQAIAIRAPLMKKSALGG